MANFPNSMYSEGTFAINTNPFTAYYLNSLNRKRAKDEALSNYYNNFTKSVNPAGMRTQDIEGGWMQKVHDWQDYYHQNERAIRDPKLDGGKAYNEFGGRYQDILNDTEKSKNRAATISKVFPIISDPEKRSRLTDNVIPAIHEMDKSIYEQPNDTDLSSIINFKPKQLTANDLEGFNKYFTNGMKMSEGNPQVVVDPKTKTKMITTESAYTPKDLSMIAERAEDYYKTNTDFKSLIDGMNNERDYNDLNKVFKQLYNRDIDIQHPEEMAAAYALKNNQQKVTNTKDAAYSNPYELEALREQYWDYTQTGTQKQINNSIDDLVDKQIAFAREPFNAGLPLRVDPATLKALNVDNLKLSPDGKFVIPVWGEKTGTDPKTSMDIIKEKQGTPMSIDDYKAAIGKRNIGAKYFQKQSAPQQTTTEKKSSSTKKSYKGLDKNGNPIFE